MARTALVVTTIFEPHFLPGYLDNARRFGRDESFTVFVIVDRKTPASVAIAARAARRDGHDVRCPDLGEQEAFLRRIGLPVDFVPWDSDNRRNVAFLMALESGCDILVSIDDDNYCIDAEDYVGAHESRLGAVSKDGPDGDLAFLAQSEESQPAFLNVCSLLDCTVAAPVFPRGFPYFARGAYSTPPRRTAPAEAICAINAGLWLVDPDVDAITRVGLAPKAERFKGPSVMLGRGVWSPINSQNTALSREAAFAYYYVRMGDVIHGMPIDRYGDILSGYFVQSCAKHLGHTVRFGAPIAEHRRTPHNLFKDLHHELAGIVMLEDLLPWLTSQRLSGNTYVEVYGSLAEALDDAATRFRGFVWDDGGREFLCTTASRMRTWLAAVRRFL